MSRDNEHSKDTLFKLIVLHNDIKYGMLEDM